MRHESDTAERVLARIAGDAKGIVTRAEALEAGVTPAEIRHRLRVGALLREYPGVYRVGHRAPSVEARYMAAVKACGQGAALSGLAAAHLLRIVKGPASPPEVTAPTRRRVKGLTTRRSLHLDAMDVTRWRGIPVTTPARTLIDIAALLPAGQLARACHEAGVLHGTTPRHVEALLARRPSSTGAGKLRAVILGEQRVTLSALERAFLEFLREAGFPLPETNRPAGGRRVDCRWPAYSLTVELDSYRYHNSRHSWEQDRRRERQAYARGDDFRRYTYADVMERPGMMMRELTSLLTRRVASRSQDDSDRPR